jgi:hypothetical protein
MNPLAHGLSLALDPAWFMQHVGLMPDPWQAQLLRSKTKRLLLNCSRQSGKSTTTAILALYEAIHFPESLILLFSPSLRQSSELFKKVTERLSSLDVRPKLTEDNRLSLRFDNGSRVVSLPSTEGTIRGFSGATLIIVDEASRVPDDLYRAMRPMLAVSGGRLVLMSTPFGRRGFFFEEWQAGAGEWERIAITADQCPRITKAFLAEELATLGEWWYKQEYFCIFVETVDQLYTYESIQSAFDHDVVPLFGTSNGTGKEGEIAWSSDIIAG